MLNGGRPDKPNESMPEQMWELMQWCLASEPADRPSFTEIIRVLGDCLTSRDVLTREVFKFTVLGAPSSGNTSSEPIMRPPINAKSIPIIAPGSKFDFLNRQVRHTRSSTVDTNSPVTGGTCSTATTMVYNSQSNGSNASVVRNLQNARANGPLDGQRSADRRRRRGSRPISVENIIENAAEEAAENQQRLAQQNFEANAELANQLNQLRQHRPFLKKISGQSLNRISGIFRPKDGREFTELRQSKDGQRPGSLKDNNLNMPKSIEKAAPKPSLSAQPDTPRHRSELPGDEAAMNSKSFDCSMIKPTAKDELILVPSKLKVYPLENAPGSNGSAVVRTHQV